MDHHRRVLTREDFDAAAVAAPAQDPAEAAAADRAAIARTTIPRTIRWFNQLARRAEARHRQLVHASRRAIDAVYRRARRVRALALPIVEWHGTSRREDAPPAVTVLLADALARHAPPVRDLTRSTREVATT
jgi:hypothetical protein